MATDFDSLIPTAVSTALLDAVTVESVALSLGTVVRMPEGMEQLPIVSALPTAGFVNPRFVGRKPATDIEWSSQLIVPEEIACALAIPSAFVDDAGFPVWEQVRPLLASAVARVFDDAVLFGNGEPATFPPNGVSGGTVITGADALEAIDKGMAAIEAQGLVPNGIASGSQIGTALRQEYRSLMVPPDTAPAHTLYGRQVSTTPIWDDTKGDAIVGDWSKLIIGVRQDIRFDTSDSAILQDTAGEIIANAFQDDLIAMRCYMRVGVVIGQPWLADGTGTADAFANVDWTP